jgi:hypothetical protein
MITKRKYFTSEPQPNVVALLLDRSGSMLAILDKTIEGTNGFIDSLKGQDVNFCLVLFDDRDPHELVHWMRSSHDGIPHLNSRTYVPRGSTPLYDATLRLIERVEEEVKDVNAKVVFAIQTDGFENASRASLERVKAAIERVQKRGWVVSFLGAGIDAWAGQQMGMNAGSTMSFAAGDIGVALRATASASASYFAGQTTNETFYAKVNDPLLKPGAKTN